MKPSGNQTQDDFNKANFSCEQIAQNAHGARMSDMRHSSDQSYIPPPTYNTQVNCSRYGNNVYCSGATSQDNSAQAAANIGRGLGNIIGGLISSIRARNDYKDCMSVYGFVPTDSSDTASNSSSKPSNKLTEEQKNSELDKIRDIDFSESLKKTNWKLKIKLRNDETIYKLNEFYDSKGGSTRNFFSEDKKLSLSFNENPCEVDLVNLKLNNNGETSLLTFKKHNTVSCEGNIEVPKLRKYDTESNILGVYLFVKED
jgi:hypothetical protein